MAYKSILIRRQDDLEVAVLAPTVRNIDLRLVFCEETMIVLDGAINLFTQIRGEGWGKEAVGDGIDRI